MTPERLEEIKGTAYIGSGAFYGISEGEFEELVAALAKATQDAEACCEVSNKQQEVLNEVIGERDRYKKALEGIEHELACAFGEYLSSAGKESVAGELWRLVNEGFERTSRK